MNGRLFGRRPVEALGRDLVLVADEPAEVEPIRSMSRWPLLASCAISRASPLSMSRARCGATLDQPTPQTPFTSLRSIASMISLLPG